MEWIVFDQRLHENDFFKLIGKALFLCQHLEHGCKNMVMWFRLAKALYEEKFKFLSDDHRNYVDRLLKLFLGNSLKDLKKISTEFGIKEKDIRLLELARESRNYICHESELSLIYAPYGPSYKWYPEEDELRRHILNIANGDYLVARWSYEFNEKLSGSFKDKDQYVNSLLYWVLISSK